MKIETERFFLRPLTKSDASERYLSWLKTEAKRDFIISANNFHTIESIQEYILRFADHKKGILFGIFNKGTNEHIGNIKYEPINEEESLAVMGILIGELAWRGKGVAPEVIKASSKFLKESRNIEFIRLGVDKGNTAAIKAYEKIGFKTSSAEDPNALKMILETKSLC